LLTTDARWQIKGSKDGDFRLVYFERKTGKLPLAHFSQVLMTSSKNHLTCPTGDVTP